MHQVLHTSLDNIQAVIFLLIFHKNPVADCILQDWLRPVSRFAARAGFTTALGKRRQAKLNRHIQKIIKSVF
jgi:hypothetical protein